MKTITVPAENWIDIEVTVEVEERKGDVQYIAFSGNRFEIHYHEEENFMGARVYNLDHGGEMFSVGKFRGDESWSIGDFGLYRTETDIIEVIANILALAIVS